MRALVALVALLALAACHSGGVGSGTVGGGGIVAVKRAPVDGPGGCGVRNAWVVTEVSGVRLSRPAIMTLETAEALDQWVRTTAIPAVGNRGGGLVELTVAAHYACRTRNSRPGARLSEHSRGRAIDISSVVMRDGSRVTVLTGWNDGRDGRLLRRLHRGACGLFGTVLGPESDRFHQDHFHFDLASYRSGPYCR
ncbi:extensin family protein [Alphaproteobacteria bacterium GH1-50]|uniref:Extensin family protein n=1 Tax=Kangsaoukella pontilimi TaxID=2691042 RepID=A0A7C9IPV8_9RHOB|nr:extensin family protein [Kangsaoukella pontilimi]MXQ08490.1 extensin family protein [Kangsaoukella pontilimi]